MADNLFPVFDIPEIDDDDEEDEKYLPSVSFDYEKGDFVLDGSHRMVEAEGREAYMQWCMKVVGTERDTFLAYDDDIGTEFDEISNVPDRESRESEIEETITDALMVHPCTEYVRDFKFEHTADSCLVTFAVKGYDWEEMTLNTTVPER